MNIFRCSGTKTADLKCQRSTAFIETSFLNVSLYGHIKGIVENDQSKRTTCMWGMFSIGIDNHFQLSLYMIDNDCQLEIYILFHLT